MGNFYRSFGTKLRKHWISLWDSVWDIGERVRTLGREFSKRAIGTSVLSLPLNGPETGPVWRNHTRCPFKLMRALGDCFFYPVNPRTGHKASRALLVQTVSNNRTERKDFRIVERENGWIVTRIKPRWARRKVAQRAREKGRETERRNREAKALLAD
jgi:hypothetical protein